MSDLSETLHGLDIGTGPGVQGIRPQLRLRLDAFLILDEVAAVGTHQISDGMVVEHAQAHGTDRLRRLPFPRLDLAKALAPAGLGVAVPLPLRDVGDAVSNAVPLVDDGLVAVEAPPAVQAQVDMHPPVRPRSILGQDRLPTAGRGTLQEGHPGLVRLTFDGRDEPDKHVFAVHAHPLHDPPIQEGGGGREAPLRGRGRDDTPDEKLVEGTG